MKCKKLAAFGLVIALAASSSSVAFAATARAVSNMENTSVQQMDQVEETDTDILSDSEVVELQQEIASYSNDGIFTDSGSTVHHWRCGYYRYYKCRQSNDP